jgi:hypothetical protein
MPTKAQSELNLAGGHAYDLKNESSSDDEDSTASTRKDAKSVIHTNSLELTDMAAKKK